MISTLFDNAVAGARQIFNAERLGMSLSDPETWRDLTSGSDSAAGIKVSEKSLLSIAPFYQGVSIIAGDVSCVTRFVYLLKDNDDRVYQRQHPVNLVLQRPNEYTTRVRLWSTAMVHALIWGNAYVYVERSQMSKRVMGLYTLLPDRTGPTWVDGELYYTTHVSRPTGGGMTKRVLPASSVLHIAGLSFDGTEGANMAKVARDTWGAAIAATQYAGKFFRRGGRRGGILEVPSSLQRKAVDVIEQGFRKKYEDPDEAFKTIVLRDNAKFHDAQVTPRDTQMVEAKESSAREAARFLNMSPAKLGVQDSISYNSAEQAQQAHLTGCLWHWNTAIEEEIMLKLFTDSERERLIVETDTSELVRPDWKSFNEVLVMQRQAEFINANTARQQLGYNRRDDPGGDEYQNTNTKPAPPGGDGGGSADPPAKPEKPEKLTKPAENSGPAVDGVLAEARSRVMARLGKHVRRAAKKPAELLAWLDDSGEEFHATARHIFGPWSDLNAALGGDPAILAADTEATRSIGKVVDALRPFLDSPHLAGDLIANVDRAMAKLETEAN